MQFYAIVATFDDAPDVPVMCSAWPASWGRDGDADEDGGAAATFDLVRGDPATLAADVVLIDVPNAPLLALLSRTATPIPGTVAAP